MLEKKDILFEDNHLLIVNKPAGILVQQDKEATTDNLEERAKAYIKEKYKKVGEAYLGVSHRIDRPVSGVVILTKTSKALARVNEDFREKKVKKTYWAIVEGRIDDDQMELVHYIAKNQDMNKSFAYKKEKPGSQRAELKFKVLEMFDRYTLIEVDLITGRHHQIRCQLSAIGHPIRGDVKYGAKRAIEDQAICLHSRSITLTHPVTKVPLTVNAPLPKTNAWGMIPKTNQ
jgi:23S rRNA pseudouridine1911/1915/1917 synthase